MDVCPYSGLPYLCNLCPEDDAPCYVRQNIHIRDDESSDDSLYQDEDYD